MLEMIHMVQYFTILDVCVGSEKIYCKMHKELGDNFLSIDIRHGNFSYQTKDAVSPTSIIVKPKVLADMRCLPFQDETIDFIVMDPPHLSCKTSLNAKESFMSKAYGSWSKKDISEIMQKANIEFNRVLKTNRCILIKVLPDDFETYKNLLIYFCFFIPIHTIRQRGCFNNKEAKAAAFWCIGIKRDDN